MLTCSNSTLLNIFGGFAMWALKILSDVHIFHETHKAEIAGLNIVLDYTIKMTIFLMFFYATYKFFKYDFNKAPRL